MNIRFYAMVFIKSSKSISIYIYFQTFHKKCNIIESFFGKFHH